MRILRSGLFSAGMILVTVVLALLSLLLLVLPYRLRFTVLSSWALFNLWWLKLTCGINHTIEGLENIPDKNCIVMAKHQSTWETMILQQYFRPQVWVLKKELLWAPFFGWGLAMLRPIAIDRGSGRKAVRQIIDQGRKRLADGCWIVVFPEGTRVAPGTRKRYGLGGAILAQETGVPVLPVVHNAGLFWRRRAFVKTPGTVSMKIGPLIESEGRQASEIIADVENWIEGELERMCAPSAKDDNQS